MARRQWSDRDRAEALAALDANGGNVSRTAQALGVPRKTLAEWRDGRTNPEVAELRQEKKAGLADRLETIAHKLADSLPDKINQAELKDAATSLGIIVDKMRLLREQPTAISRDDDSLTDSERADRIAALVESARARRDGRPSPGAVAN